MGYLHIAEITRKGSELIRIFLDYIIFYDIYAYTKFAKTQQPYNSRNKKNYTGDEVTWHIN